MDTSSSGCLGQNLGSASDAAGEAADCDPCSCLAFEEALVSAEPGWTSEVEGGKRRLEHREEGGGGAERGAGEAICC